MKKYYFLSFGLALLFSMFGCQSANDVSVQVNTNSSSEDRAGGTQVQTNTSENQPENKESSANATPAVENKTESIYTDLTSEKCKTIESNPDEGGSYIGECQGVGGFKLEVVEGDIRQTINVIYPNGKKAELEFWAKVSSAFSSVGEKAEWRVLNGGKDEKSYGLIIRYNASENPEKPEKTTSYLVVTKITKDAACITDIVKPSKDQNLTARKLADEAANKPCL